MREKIRHILETNAAIAGNRAPDFGAGHDWLNVSRPLTLHGDLAGRLVLVDFWTYCCINCLHVLPDLEFLEEKYRDAPVAFVGCHSAKFTNEADTAHVREAVLRHGIAHPVVVDRDFAIWRRYGIRGWPGMALVGPSLEVLGFLSGEGNREVLDAMIEEAMALFDRRGFAWNRAPLPLRLERLAEAASDFLFPGKIAASPLGSSLFVADTGHHRVVQLDLDGRFLLAIGTGEPGARDGKLAEASFREPQGMAWHGRDLLVADTGNHLVRRIDLDKGTVKTIAGSGRKGRERRGSFAAREAALDSPWDLAVAGDAAFVAMAGPHQVWRLDLGRGAIEPYAGDGTERIQDGPRRDAAFAQPSGLATDGERLFVADSESSAIRAIDLRTEEVTTLAGARDEPRDLFHFGDDDGVGPGRRFQHPLGIALSGGTLFVADTFNHKLKTLDPATRRVKTLAGDGTSGRDDGARPRFFEPGGLAFAGGGRLYVADTNNHRVRVVDPASGRAETLVPRGVPIPMRHVAARADDLRAIPDLPGTARFATRASVAPGRGVLSVRLELPPRRSLASGAPHLFVIEPGDGAAIRFESTRGPIAAPAFEIPYEATAGAAAFTLRVLYYHCGADGTCQVRSAAFPVTASVEKKGARRIEIAVTAEGGETPEPPRKRR